jgi:hypothetical protein
MSQDAFMREVINAMDSTSSSKVISRPTLIRMLDYKTTLYYERFRYNFRMASGCRPHKTVTVAMANKLRCPSWIICSIYNTCQHDIIIVVTLFWCFITCMNGIVPSPFRIFDAKINVTVIHLGSTLQV